MNDLKIEPNMIPTENNQTEAFFIAIAKNKHITKNTKTCNPHRPIYSNQHSMLI